MRAFIYDVDAGAKLAAMGLADDVAAAFGFSHDEIYVLDSAPYVIGKQFPKRKTLGPTGIAKAVEYCRSVKNLAVAPDPGLHDLMAGVPDIDSGEAVIFASAATFDDVIICTGDKKALRAIEAEPSLAPIRERFKGRVVCLEEAVRVAIGSRGFDAVKRAARDILNIPERLDGALSVIFSSDACDDQSVASGLSSFIGDLQKNGGSMLYEPPPIPASPDAAE